MTYGRCATWSLHRLQPPTAASARNLDGVSDGADFSTSGVQASHKEHVLSLSRSSITSVTSSTVSDARREHSIYRLQRNRLAGLQSENALVTMEWEEGYTRGVWLLVQIPVIRSVSDML